MVGAVSRSWWAWSPNRFLSAMKLGNRRFGPLSAALAILVASAVACSTADLTPASHIPTTSGGVGVVADGKTPAESSDGSPREEPGGLPFETSHGVTIQVQPTDSGAAILSAIRGAEKSVHMTMYLLTNSDVIDALGDLKEAGKDVKVILNKTFPQNGGNNQPAFNRLSRRGVEVTWAPSGYTFTHSKTIIVDAKKVFIMTMNLTASSANNNREYIATDTDPQDVADLERIFEADFTNRSVTLPSKLVISPSGANTLHNARSHIKTLIDSAKKSLDVAAQSLSDDDVVDAIIQAHESNIDVRVVINGDYSTTPAQLEAIGKLKHHGVPLRSLTDPEMHAKAIVVDESYTFVGSHNLTSTALEQNREIGVLTDDKAEAVKVRGVIRDDFEAGTLL